MSIIKTITDFITVTTSFFTNSAIECMSPQLPEEPLIHKCGHIKLNGDVLFDDEFKKLINYDREKLFPLFIRDHGCYWHHKNGKTKKTHCFDNGSDYFEEGLARFVNNDKKFGYMNKKLDEVIEAKYDFVFPFKGNRAFVCNGCKSEKEKGSEYSSVVGGKWMLINKKGKIIKECKGSNGFTNC